MCWVPFQTPFSSINTLLSCQKVKQMEEIKLRVPHHDQNGSNFFDRVLNCKPASALHHLWYLLLRTLFANGLDYMPRVLKVSRPIIAILWYYLTT